LPGGLSYNRRGLPYEPWFAAVAATTGVIANIGLHPVSLGPAWMEVSADYVAPCRDALEATLGGTAVLLQAGLGDVDPPNERWSPQDVPAFDNTHSLGHDVADAVAGLLADARPLAVDRLTASSRWIEAPVGTTPLAALTGNATTLDVELVEWNIGELHVVAVPGEPFHKLVNQIIASRSGPVLIAALAPVWQGYLPVPFGEGYEETVSYGAEAVATIAAALTA
jgi:hypothetical protein